MSKAVILSHKPLLTKKEEKALAKAVVNIKTFSKFKADQWKKIGNEYDIAVIDDELFGGDVYQACSQVRASSKAIIILLGSTPSWEMWEKSKEIGFDHYCRKPIKPDDLEHRIKLTKCEVDYRLFREKLNSSARGDGGTPTVEPEPETPCTSEPIEKTGPVAEVPREEAPKPAVADEIKPIDEPVVRPAVEPVSEPTPEPPVRPAAEQMPAPAPIPDVSPAQQASAGLFTGLAGAGVEEKPAPGNRVTASVPDNSNNIWQDAKVARLMSGFLSGKINQLKPVIDLRLEDGFSYREADETLGTTGRETALMLESLVKEGLLLSESYEKILVSPAGSVQLIPVERCPSCDSSQLTRGQLIEHFSCGHIGPEEEFTKGLNQVCPKCKRELKLIGTDYRKPGARYVCDSCHGVFPTPVIKCHCLRTGEYYHLEELRHISLNSYQLNGAYKKKLEFELEPKRQLVEYMTRLGYEVQESVQVQGRSGAMHTIDIQASMHGLITKHIVAVGILAAQNDESEVAIDSLFSFDSKIYDTGIENKMVIAVPRFSAEAAKFAERQGIRVYNIEELRALLVRQVNSAGRPADGSGGQPDGTRNIPDLSELGPKGWLKWLLDREGYHVDEKAKVVGRSGAEHILDLYAQKDDGIINHKLAVCVILNEKGTADDVNEVIKFDTATYDAHIRDKVIISVPSLSKEANRFAEYQRIKVLEAKELAEFSSQQEADNLANRFSELISRS